MIELYVIGYFEDGVLKRLVRKMCYSDISGYDNMSGARRGLSQIKSDNPSGDYRILKALDLTEVSG